MSAENPAGVEYQTSNQNVTEFVRFGMGLGGTSQKITTPNFNVERFANFDARLAALAHELGMFIETDGNINGQRNKGIGFFTELVAGQHLQQLIGQNSAEVIPVVSMLDVAHGPDNCDAVIGHEVPNPEVFRDEVVLFHSSKRAFRPIAAVDFKYLARSKRPSNDIFHLPLQSPLIELGIRGSDIVDAGTNMTFLEYVHHLTAAIRDNGVPGFYRLMRLPQIQSGMNDLFKDIISFELARATVGWETLFPSIDDDSKVYLEQQRMKIGYLVELLGLDLQILHENQAHLVMKTAYVNPPILDFRQLRR